MHQFQPYPIEEIELNPFTKFKNDWALLTVKSEDKTNSMTVSWGGLGVLWDKPIATIYVRESRYTKELIDHANRFSLTFLEERFRPLLKYMGEVSGRIEDKIKTAGLHIDNHIGVPYIDEGNFVIICRKMAAVPMPESTFLDPAVKSEYYENDDFHTMYVGEILSMLAR